MEFPPIDYTYDPYQDRLTDNLSLFEHCIKYVVYCHDDLQPKQNSVWANILFRKFVGNDYNNAVNYMGRVKYNFNIYFVGSDETQNDLKYTFDVEKIVRDFPYLFAGYIPQQKDLFLQIRDALDKEIEESRMSRNTEKYDIVDVREYKNKNSENEWIYLLTLNVPEDSDPHFKEGLRIRVAVSRGALTESYFCETVDYDFDRALLSVTCEKRIVYNINRDKLKVVVDTSFIIQGLQTKLSSLAGASINPDYPICKFLHSKTKELSPVEHPAIPSWIAKDLESDHSQYNAYYAALDKDITFIWGPPGTGKSYTLARIIRALYSIENERNVVCCISNVAVDQITNKVIDILEGENEVIEYGNFYRAGHTMDDRILATDYLFPNDETVQMYRNKIQSDKKVLEGLTDTEEDVIHAIEIKAEIKDLRKRLKSHTEYLVKKSRVVFSTVSNFTLNNTINECEFDNLIVDEASMLAMPELIVLACKVKKRIILVGDFQQLSPISLVPNPWLRTNVFNLCGIDLEHLEHPALKPLLYQRRSYETLVNVVNATVYKGQLKVVNDLLDEKTKIGPFPRQAVSLVDFKDGLLRFTRGNTRQNEPNSEVVLQYLDEYANLGRTDISIGVISPYIGQTSLYRKKISLRNYPPEFEKNIRVGTIHTFQGSECDVILLDLVDCENRTQGHAANIGRIYYGQEGVQLLNVAISRARYKLIVVGDADYFERAPGNHLEGKTLSIFNKLKQYKRTI